MAWTARLKSKQSTLDFKKLVVEFTNGDRVRDETFKFSNNSTLGEIKTTIRARITGLDAFDATDAALIEGEAFDLRPPDPPPPPPPPPQEELDFLAWLVFWERLTAAQRLVDHGVIPSNNAKFIALQNKVASDFRAAFLDMLSE